MILLCLSVQAPNRRVQRLMEKENKKLRDAAKKKRNEAVRVSMGGLSVESGFLASVMVCMVRWI